MTFIGTTSLFMSDALEYLKFQVEYVGTIYRNEEKQDKCMRVDISTTIFNKINKIRFSNALARLIIKRNVSMEVRARRHNLKTDS